MKLIPQTLVKDHWYRTLSELDCGSLEFVDPDGDVFKHMGSRPGPSARFQIHDWSVVQRAAARGDIGLGEDYIAGGWDTDDLEALITYFLVNFDQLEGYANGNILNRFLFVLLNTMVRRNSMSGSRRNIEAHYDVGNDFYALWLDETMTYSSALYRGRNENLSDAQRNKYGRILSKLERERGEILEIGCGWGGFAEQAADQGHHVTGVTISPSQHAFASRRLANRAEIRLDDYRNIGGRFGSIVSIEMFEAVGERYWPQYFSVVAERLKEGGRAVVQTILIRDELFSAYRRRSDFIRHYVFPGGMLPSLARFKDEAAKAGLKAVDVFSFGQDYARTLREWSVRMQEREKDILAQGRSRQFLRNWQFYLGMCAAAFAVGRTDVAQIELVRA
ncbi:MAG TPA: cyclopropane-fatty-acyl-phospholipid synthase family protein [Rhizomicrobium sp.]|nr:cyclopropane-fatty-acyl-phospholipid synthase family protein [Rhizomicrobium sp.]